jgi:predicted small lipoprotein YifL
MTRLIPVILLWGFLLAAGCGYKGPLVMPEASSPPTAEPEQDKKKKTQ